MGPPLQRERAGFRTPKVPRRCHAHQSEKDPQSTGLTRGSDPRELHEGPARAQEATSRRQPCERDHGHPGRWFP